MVVTWRERAIEFLARGLPKPERGIISAAGGANDILSGYIDPKFVIQNPDKVLQQYGGGNLELYEAIRMDPQVKSAMQQRRGAVISRPWEVTAGGEDAASTAAADALRADIEALNWDDITEKVHWGIWYGFSVAEAVWEPRDGRWAIADIVVSRRARWRFNGIGEPRLLTRDDASQGIELPPHKTWLMRAGGDNHHEFYGEALAAYCYWPWFFKRTGIKNWAKFLEKYAAPTAVGKYPEGSTEEAQAVLLNAVRSFAIDTGITIPKDMEIELVEAARNSRADYETFKSECNADITKIILSQTMTTEDGSSRSQSETHLEVRDEVVRTDADLICGSFNRSIAYWHAAFNFAGAKPAKLYRKMEDEEDVDDVADRDAKLFTLGWQRTEESFREIYGDGYERKPEPEPVDEIPPGTQRKQDPQFHATDARPLYVRRDVVNGAEILAWAKAQGFKTTLQASDLHVAIAYSRTPVDWLKVGTDFGGWKGKIEVEPGGPRIVDRFQDDGPVVLLFTNDNLRWRHEAIREAGASWDHEDYHPHVTISYDPGDIDLEAIEPYRGKIILGPEIFEPIDEEWKEKLEANEFAAGDLDAVDRLVSSIGENGQTFVSDLIAEARSKLAGVTDEEQARILLLELIEQMDTTDFADLLGRSGVVIRGVQQAGIDEDVVA